MTHDQSPEVDSLLDELEKTEPAFESLGTPEPRETDAVRRLVAMGAPIVPHLIERTRAAGSAKTMAYLALILGRIGDARAVTPLRELQARYQAREPKGEWDYAVLGQCNVALGRLEGAPPSSIR